MTQLNAPHMTTRMRQQIKEAVKLDTAMGAKKELG
jgi:hypothetical protein